MIVQLLLGADQLCLGLSTSGQFWEILASDALVTGVDGVYRHSVGPFELSIISVGHELVLRVWGLRKELALGLIFLGGAEVGVDTGYLLVRLYHTIVV